MLKKLITAAAILIAIPGTAAAHGPYQPYPYYGYRPVPVYPVVPYQPYYGGIRRGDLYGAAVVGGIVTAVVNNAMQQPRTVIVQPAPQPVYREYSVREDWVYDPSCDCKRRVVTNVPVN